MAPAGLRLRSERPADGPSIRSLNLAAFPTSAEADLVERIRAGGAFRPEHSLVAQVGTRTVGHLLLSPVTLHTADGPVPVLALAPMAVLPDHQRRGIGSALVTAALDAAEVREEPLVVVLGHPWYYPRFGFRPASRYGIRAPFPVRDEVFMVKPLTRYRAALRGRIEYPAAFEGRD